MRRFLQHVTTRALTTNVTLIPGDGIGPEVMSATKELIAAVKAPVKFDEFPLSEIQGYTTDEYNALIENLKKNRVCLKGFILAGHKFKQDSQRSLITKMKQELNIFASIVHVKSFPGIRTRHQNLNFMVIRETTEGEYCGQEHAVGGPEVISSLKIMTQEKSERVARFAFDLATKNKRRKVTCVHKANIMKLGDGLFLRACQDVAKLYPNIEFEDMIIDNTCMQLVSNPHQFDIMVMPNLYGNIIGNIGAGLIGGSGVVPGASVSNDIAFFEAGARYTFQSGAGKDICNPTAMFMAAGNMLFHIGLGKYGNAIKQATRKVLKVGKVKTRDMRGYSSTSAFTAEVMDQLTPVSGASKPMVLTGNY